MGSICIFGDSITWGAGIPTSKSWTNLLRDYIEKQEENLMELYELGIDRNTSQDLLKRFDVEASSRNPTTIIIAIGTNDSFYRKTTDNPSVPINEFENNLIELINKSKKFTNKIIFLGLCKGSDSKTKPLLRSTTHKCYDKENIKKYNNIIKKICKQKNILFIDIINKLTDSDFYDGLHPNEHGHIKIFENVKPYFNINHN